MGYIYITVSLSHFILTGLRRNLQSHCKELPQPVACTDAHSGPGASHPQPPSPKWHHTWTEQHFSSLRTHLLRILTSGTPLELLLIPHPSQADRTSGGPCIAQVDGLRV